MLSFFVPVAGIEPARHRLYQLSYTGYCSHLLWLQSLPYGLIGGLTTCRVVRGLCFLGTRPRVAQRLAGSYTQLFELPAHHLLYASSGLMFR